MSRSSSYLSFQNLEGSNHQAITLQLLDPPRVALESGDPKPLKLLEKYMKEMSQNKGCPELIANEYIRYYPKDMVFVVDKATVEKFLPNININFPKIDLFGVTKTKLSCPNRPNEFVYTFCPSTYIRATAINSPGYLNFHDRIDFACKLYTCGTSDRITKKGLEEMMTLYIKENKLNLTENVIKELAETIFKRVKDCSEATATLTRDELGQAQTIDDILDNEEVAKKGTPQNDELSYEQFGAFLNQYQRNSLKARWDNKGLVDVSVDIRKKSQRLEVQSTSRGLSQQSCFSRFINRCWIDFTKWIWLLIWLGGVAWFFYLGFIDLYGKSSKVSGGVAKGSAGVVRYCMTVMFLLVTKTVTTVLRKVGLGKILPLNYNVYFHTVIGFTTLIAAWAHSLAHLIGFLPAVSKSEELMILVKERRSYLGWVFQSVAGITGIISLIVITVMVVLAIEKLRNKNYERFWYSHLLWLVLVILLCFHGMRQHIDEVEFWKWIVVPSSILLLEGFFSLGSHIYSGYTIKSLKYLKNSEIIELRVSKPRGFKFSPGQYASIKIPKISWLEWHPFSFSGSENEDELTFHISSKGDWTWQLKKIAEELVDNPKDVPKILLTGPYGAPSQHYNKYKRLMLISTGVGATPFASIIRDLIDKVKKEQGNGKLIEVEFYWINRMPSSPAWLYKLFTELKENPALRDIIKVRMFLTYPSHKYDLRSFLIWEGLKDLCNGERRFDELEHFSLTYWGRPDWDQIFQKKITEVKDGTVGVFLCGNKIMSREVLQKCVQHSSSKVKFEYSSEIY